jgi:hypothetical protein
MPARNVAYIGAPVLMTPFSFKWHLKLRTRLALRLLQAVELPVRGHDPATGRGADLDAYAQQRRIYVDKLAMCLHNNG